MTLWEKCVDFHGHHCGGLRIGYAAAEYAMKLLSIGFSDNEDVVCISENDACGVDAIQVMLGCSIGKGNLLFHMSRIPRNLTVSSSLWIWERRPRASWILTWRFPPTAVWTWASASI